MLGMSKLHISYRRFIVFVHHRVLFGCTGAEKKIAPHLKRAQRIKSGGSVLGGPELRLWTRKEFMQPSTVEFSPDFFNMQVSNSAVQDPCELDVGIAD